MIKAIETVYNGYRFRSRLEARWAVFFDALKIKYQYESEGYNIDGVWYLPDFKLTEGCMIPPGGWYVEIKGIQPNSSEVNKFIQLCEKTRTEGVILWGNIGIDETKCFLCQYKKCNCPSCEEFHMYYDYKDRCYFWSPDMMLADLHKNIKDGIMSRSEAADFQREFEQTMNNAWDTARQARFEYGETPRI